MKNLTGMERRRLAFLAGGALLALLAGPASTLAQCSLCRDALAASSSETREAMNYAIIGLAFAPYVIAAMAAWALSPAVRAQVKERLDRLARKPWKPR